MHMILVAAVRRKARDVLTDLHKCWLKRAEKKLFTLSDVTYTGWLGAKHQLTN